MRTELPPGARGQTWPRRLAADNSTEDLLGTYRLMLPDHAVRLVVFRWPERDANRERTNAYASQSAWKHSLPALLVTTPEWSDSAVRRRVEEGGLVGLKPYASWAPLGIPEAEIANYDFLPHVHLEVADRHG